MCKVSHYFCIFCDFTCEEYDNAFDHYFSHMFAANNCEICDYDKLVPFKADSSDLSNKCYHESYFRRNAIDYKQHSFWSDVIHYWIKRFLTYQTNILHTTYEKLLLQSKVCVECAVCRYLLKKYKSDGGDMNRIEYIRDNKVEHCYQHMRYNPNSTRINVASHVANFDNNLRMKTIVKLEAFIEHCCDTFIISEDIHETLNSVTTGKNDDHITISDGIEWIPALPSDLTEISSQVSPSFEDTLQQSLAPILAKIADINSRIDSESEKTEIKIEKIQTNIKPDSTLDNFAQTTASISEKLSVVESELNTIKSERNEATPAGTVAYFASPNEPSGWLKADGQTVSRVKYSKLFVTIGCTFGCGDGFNTFNLPDLRGEFIRGWSDGRDVDKTRAFGSFQWGSSIPLGGNSDGSEGVICTQSLAFAGVSFDDSSELKVTGGQTRDGITYPSASIMGHIIGGYSSKRTTSWNALKGTRPRNIALLACIKY